MTELTNKHYEIFETKELARERIKAEEEARNSAKNEILTEIKLLRKSIDSVETKLEAKIDTQIAGMKWWTIKAMGGLLLIASSAIVGAIKLIPTAVQIVEKIPH